MLHVIEDAGHIVRLERRDDGRFSCRATDGDGEVWETTASDEMTAVVELMHLMGFEDMD